MPQIYISYRPYSPDRSYTARLYPELAAHFGRDQIRMDTDEDVIRKSDAMIVVIGYQWLHHPDGHGLFDGPNSAFSEIELALNHNLNIPVIPVLFEGATMPSSDEIGSSALGKLRRYTAFAVSDEHFSEDVSRLISALDKVLNPATSTPKPELSAPTPPANMPTVDLQQLYNNPNPSNKDIQFLRGLTRLSTNPAISPLDEPKIKASTPTSNSTKASQRTPFIFISYSHQDSNYAHKLAKELESHRLSVWIDDRIDYGSQWPQVIQEVLDNSTAFIVIMTPRSYKSEWVQNELSRAKRKGKPIYPLLLEGETWLSVEATQHTNVLDGKLPPKRFYELLAQVIWPL